MQKKTSFFVALLPQIVFSCSQPLHFCLYSSSHFGHNLKQFLHKQFAHGCAAPIKHPKPHGHKRTTNINQPLYRLIATKMVIRVGSRDIDGKKGHRMGKNRTINFTWQSNSPLWCHSSSSHFRSGIFKHKSICS